MRLLLSLLLLLSLAAPAPASLSPPRVETGLARKPEKPKSPTWTIDEDTEIFLDGTAIEWEAVGDLTRLEVVKLVMHRGRIEGMVLRTKGK
jgi:hypothetical protein